MRRPRRQLLVLLFSVALCLVNLLGCAPMSSTSLGPQVLNTSSPAGRTEGSSSAAAPAAPAIEKPKADPARPLKNEAKLAVAPGVGKGAKAFGSNQSRAQGPQTSAAGVAAEATQSTDKNNTLPRSTQTETLRQTLDRLAKGLFFHTVPPTLTAGHTVTIQAGVAKTFTETLQNALQGPVTLLPNVHYDPQGIDIQIKVDPADFLVKPKLEGTHPPFVNGKPTVWQWEVTPLRQGQRYLVLTSAVKLTAPTLQQPYTYEVAIAKEPVTVKFNWLYSVQQLLVCYWPPIVLVILSLIVCAFCLLSLGKALRARRPRQEEQFPLS